MSDESNTLPTLRRMLSRLERSMNRLIRGGSLQRREREIEALKVAIREVEKNDRPIK